MSTSGGTKAVVAALAANVGIALTKFVAWGLTGASSLLAEAIHSTADSGNQVLLLIGGKRAQREATRSHPFGYGRVRYVYAFGVAIVLFSLGGLFALFEAYEKFREVRSGEPNELLASDYWWVAIAVLGVAIVMESLSLRTAIGESNKLRGNIGWVEFIRRAKAPELPVILLEDTGALLGLVFALFGVGMTLITGNAYFDVFGTAMIGLLLVAIAVILVSEMASLIVGEGGSQQDVDAVLSALEGTPGITRVIHLKTLYTGPEEMLVAAKFATDPTAVAADIARTIDGAEHNIRAAVPDAKAIYLEPDLYDPDYVPAQRPDTRLPTAE